MKLLRYVIINTLFAIALYYGLMVENIAAANIIKFVTIAMFVISIIGLFGVLSATKLEIKNIRTVPRGVELVYEFAVIGMFVSVGWFGYATMYLISTVVNDCVAETFSGKNKDANI